MNSTTHALRPLAMCALLGLTAVVSAQRTTLVFGVYTSDKPATMYKMFSPVTNALGKRATDALGERTEVKLRVYLTYEAALKALVRGNVDIARFGPSSYVLAKAQNPKIELLAMESKKGKKTFRGLIVVRSDSRIQKMADLRGAKFAFGNKNSTVGRFLAQEQLLASGISATELSKYEYLERHDRVFRAVQLRLFDAGSLKNGTFKKLNTKNQLRVLKEFAVPTKPWVLRSGVSPKVSAALRSALLDLKDEKALKSLKVSGFLKTSDAEYASVRASMLSALGFDPRAKPLTGSPLEPGSEPKSKPGSKPGK